ncbi:MAG: hypothetical protein VB875_06260 [Pirellulales bacterium]
MDSDEAQAIAAIEKLGWVKVDRNKAVVKVRLDGTEITDAGLVHLKGMKLKSLGIPEQAMTDLGLRHFLEATEPQTMPGRVNAAAPLTQDPAAKAGVE